MFDDPDDASQSRRVGPEQAAAEKLEELRMYAELAAVFEGTARFGHAVRHDLPARVARQLQRGMVTLERARDGSVQLIPPEQVPLAHELLRLHRLEQLTLCDYHGCGESGELHIARWVAGSDFDTVFERLQAHFESMLEGHIEEEREARGWRGDPYVSAYLAALERLKPDLPTRYLLPYLRSGAVPACLSTHTVDNLSVSFLCSTVMQIDAPVLFAPWHNMTAEEAAEYFADIDDDEVIASMLKLGREPGSEPDDLPPVDLSALTDPPWLSHYFKLFLLRGMVDQSLVACFYAFFQLVIDDRA